MVCRPPQLTWGARTRDCLRLFAKPSDADALWQPEDLVGLIRHQLGQRLADLDLRISPEALDALTKGATDRPLLTLADLYAHPKPPTSSCSKQSSDTVENAYIVLSRGCLTRSHPRCISPVSRRRSCAMASGLPPPITSFSGTASAVCLSDRGSSRRCGDSSRRALPACAEACWDRDLARPKQHEHAPGAIGLTASARLRSRRHHGGW